MNAEAELTLNNLNILSVLSHNDKLMTNEDQFDIYIPTVMRGISRMWYGERRSQNIARIRTTARTAMSYTTKYVEDISRLRTLPRQVMVCFQVETVTLQYHRMLEGLREGMKGMNNLLQTYRDDAASSSQIEGIIREVRDYVELNDRHRLEFLGGETPGDPPLASPPSPPSQPFSFEPSGS